MSKEHTAIHGRGQANLFARYFARFDEREVMRWAFRGLLAGTIAVIGLDLKELHDARQLLQPGSAAVHVEPVLQPAPARGGQTSHNPRDYVTTSNEVLRRPLRFELQADGVMSAVGNIDIGAAERFAEAVEVGGSLVKTLSLNSSGGSVDDAMAMARLVRERGISTMVADGALCASACPLLLAGGVSRHAGDKTAIGVHQFYAPADVSLDPAQAIADTQTTTARISRYLAGMGVDPALWLHALDTPPQRLYYLSHDEMRRYGLVTEDPTIASH